MNKKEASIILKTYSDIYYSHVINEFDKSESIREFSFLLKSLGMNKEKTMVENVIICERDNIRGTAKEMYRMIFESFSEHEVYVNYDLSEIDMYYENLKYSMSEEDIKCHNARIKYLTN